MKNNSPQIALIPETFGRYGVSSDGRIYSFIKSGKTNTLRDEPKEIQPYTNNAGYKMINLRINNKAVPKLVHRLVAECFIPNPLNLPEINHIDEDKSNNTVENLEWCTHKYNINHGTSGTRKSICVMANFFLSDGPLRYTARWAKLFEDSFNEEEYRSNGVRRKKCKGVALIDSDGNIIRTFESAYEAAEEMHIRKSRIRHAIRRGTSAKGYLFKRL